MNNILSKKEIELIQKSGRILKEAIEHTVAAIEPGKSTLEIDQIAEKYIVSKGARPSFKDYFVEGVGHYPASICISVNHEVVHGLPSGSRMINDGDLISIDLGVECEGLFTDMAVTIGVGNISEDAKRLIETTEYCLEEAIKLARPGNRLGDIGNRVQTIAESSGFGVVRDLVGHGIGRRPHLKPQIPNFGEKNTGELIRPFMALAIEPMVTLGDYKVSTNKDGWTIITEDGSLAAHFEHTLVVTEDSPLVVTR